MLFPSSPRLSQTSCFRFRAAALAGACALELLSGCGRIKTAVVPQQVYVTAKQAYLRDRVAAVSNRTGEVQNGDKLTVIGHQRRFLQVKAPNGATGWIEEKLTADQAVADQFDQLKEAHEKDPVIVQAVTRDEVYLHVAPGRETMHFFRLAENTPLNLLERASLSKAVPQVVAAAAPSKPATSRLPVRASGEAARREEERQRLEAAAAPQAAAAPVLEDWWLVRTGGGQTGWIYGRMIDVTAPDALVRYAEGQRIVGAYKLTDIDDPDSGVMNNGQQVTRIPEYVTVLAPFKAGLPYDFNQIRVFSWNPRKHRYETAFRERNIAGYLPVHVGPTKDPYNKDPRLTGPMPGFTVHLLPADVALPVPDPATGLIHPQKTIADTIRLEGSVCRRVAAPNAPPLNPAHPDPEPEKGAKGKKRR